MDSSNWQHDGFALDVLIFIDISSNLGEISSTAARATSQIGLVYSVKFVYENVWAFHFNVVIYGIPGCYGVFYISAKIMKSITMVHYHFCYSILWLINLFY
jgi:hypothetical protein